MSTVTSFAFEPSPSQPVNPQVATMTAIERQANELPEWRMTWTPAKIFRGSEGYSGPVGGLSRDLSEFVKFCWPGRLHFFTLFTQENAALRAGSGHVLVRMSS